MSLASLAMYSSPAAVEEATDRLWTYIRDELRAAGLPEVPDQLDKAVRHDDAWLRPDLLLSQTCGYPYVRRLRGRVRLVATPEYEHPGCFGPLKCSFIVVPKDSRFQTLTDLRGTRAAINSPESNSGTNLFRALLAPHAENGRFFSAVVETGSHNASLEYVSNGIADVASIDCITYANILRFEPRAVDGVRIFAETPRGPGLPYITRAAATDEELSILRSVLAAIADDRRMDEVRDLLSLRKFSVLEDHDYQPLLEFEREAARLGYPDIA